MAGYNPSLLGQAMAPKQETPQLSQQQVWDLIEKVLGKHNLPWTATVPKPYLLDRPVKEIEKPMLGDPYTPAFFRRALLPSMQGWPLQQQTLGAPPSGDEQLERNPQSGPYDPFWLGPKRGYYPAGGR